MSTNAVNEILTKFNERQLRVLRNFLNCEIPDDMLQDTIAFVESNDDDFKKELFGIMIYTGEAYKGVFIEGNQYLISSNSKDVQIIDEVSEEFGGGEGEYTRLSMSVNDFVCLISEKYEVIKLIDNKVGSDFIIDD